MVAVLPWANESSKVREPEMASSDFATELTALEYLELADHEMAAGNHQTASGLLWKAVILTFIKLADKRGLDYEEDLIDLAKSLEADGSVYEGYFRSNLSAGKLLRDHAELNALCACEAEGAYETMRQFILEQHVGDSK